MKNTKTLTTLLFWFVAIAVFADSGIYICGHFRRDRTRTVPELKASGFTFGFFFNLNVEENGDLTTDGQIICRDGEYIFGETNPYYVDDVNALLTGNTSILRLEHCIGGWNNHSYLRIANWVNADEAEGGGTGPNSILYRNFKALKDAIPSVIAVNNDIEHDYVYAPHAQFHIMLYDIGFKTTIAPYHAGYRNSYWIPFVNQINEARPGAVDRNYLQCYDGGAGNNPNDWKIGGLPIYGSFNIEGGWLGEWLPVSKISDKLISWQEDTGIVGGFFWNYNENRNLKPIAGAVNEVFGGGEVLYRDQIVAMVYPVTDYKSPQVDFSMGEYTFEQINGKGFDPGNLSAVKLKEGIKIILFTGEDNTGESFEITEDTPDIAAIVGDSEIKSWTVMANCIEALDGKEFYVRNGNSGYYLKPYQNTTINATNIQQKENDGTDYDVWVFEKVKDGLYKITNKGSEKALTVRGARIYDATIMEQNTYLGSESQHFIVTYNEDSDAYRLIALNSLKYIGLTKNRETMANASAVLQGSSSTIGIEWELEELEETCTCTGLEDITPEPFFNVYPSTVTDNVYVESDEVSITKVTILDLSGRRLIEDAGNKINVSSLPKGVYLLLVEGEGLSKPAPYKIVKQ